MTRGSTSMIILKRPSSQQQQGNSFVINSNGITIRNITVGNRFTVNGQPFTTPATASSIDVDITLYITPDTENVYVRTIAHSVKIDDEISVAGVFSIGVQSGNIWIDVRSFFLNNNIEFIVLLNYYNVLQAPLFARNVILLSMMGNISLTCPLDNISYERLIASTGGGNIMLIVSTNH